MTRPNRKAPPRSPLSMVVLALLAEAPMHVYRMQQLIRERAKADVVNIGSRTSLHQVAERLLRDGLIAVSDIDPTARGRTTYSLTSAGAETLRDWLAEIICQPRNEYPVFPAALAFAALLTPERLAEHLERRGESLEQALAASDPQQTMQTHDLQRIFVIEDDYRAAMLAAELVWVRRVVDDLRRGTFTWSSAEIAAAQRRLGTA